MAQSISLTLSRSGDVGEPLPTVFKALDFYGAKIRKGQLTLVAAASGVGKSTFATHLALKSRARTLFFSADSDPMTVGIRIGTMLQDGATTDAIEKKLVQRDSSLLEFIHKASENIWFSFQAAPTPKDISDEVDAYGVVYGEYPDLIVIDNLMDVPTGTDDERNGQDAILDYLKQLARRTSSAVVVLCHVVASGKYDGEFVDFVSGKFPIPRSGVMNKQDKRPRLILTLYEADPVTLGVCIVKNNNGQADASGNLRVDVPFIKERMWIGS